MTEDLRPSLLLVMGHMHEGMSDHDFMHEEMRLAIAAEGMGYSAVWCVEHHFDRPYSMCPDNFVYLTYLAAKTSTIKIGIGACILPWNDPLRVSEKVNLLDIMSDGRLLLGLGRGLSRMEYGGFGINMDEARDRWSESYTMITKAQETGFIEGDGKFWQQPRTQVAPFSGIPLTGRMTEIAMSEESQVMAAKLGLKMATFAVLPMAQMAPQLLQYRDVYEQTHGEPAPPPMVCDMITVHEDEEEALRLHREAVGAYFFSLIKHYELAGDHFKDIKGYESYDAMAGMFKAAGLDAAAEAYVQANTYGTPTSIVEKLRANRDVAGDYEISAILSIGGRPYDQVESMMRTFGERVIPEIVKMRSPVAAAA
ncbi:MAG TPA: LLM class flavin-dependent oxidoreductase [Solirubrobacteraceae bacterium]|jgi:alkanesulfonate monooxygenase SsuD/methylene tetrahydromethanopterin reductase-like flavin-dependent oxidoreductase (luciferase family)|nr:LLM class flavin-dependent oxidoreductase [Solirubrobacteraceae bacterium]